ncbi:hypothetical protein [Serratia marcescens]|uniref:hypothetical protein n=1 Tax=Serratia marcescens TaxID=615 RepID=UPI0027E47848|nr:hypothetical protein [Serratia marcescens]MDH2271319.1 hypothetical protein [Serratia marcescens]MDH2274629.1 hypothetical protein [Serratia marcescens]
MESVKESISQALKDRFTNPLWGYIVLSWIGFNWQNLAWLFMSKQDVEKRIEMITSQSGFYSHYLVLPIIAGATLAAFSPYFKVILSIIHKKAEYLLTNVERDRSLNNLQIEIDIMEKTAERNFTSRQAEAKEQKRLIEIEEEQKKLPFQTESLMKEHASLSEKTKVLSEEVGSYTALKENLLSEIEELKAKTNRIIDIFRKYNSPSNHEGIKLFINEISKEFEEIDLLYPYSQKLTSVDDAKKTLENISKISLAGLSPQSAFSESQYKMAYDQIQQSLTPHPDLAKLAASASIAFNSPSFKKIEELSRQIAALKESFPQISSLSSQTSEALRGLTNENIKSLTKYANLVSTEKK